jgi:hypothetical protein
MRSYERNGVHLEQCDTCRGIFLDFGELESLTQLESRMSAPPAPQHSPPAPAHNAYAQNPYPPQNQYPQNPYPQNQYPPQNQYGPGGYGPGWGDQRGQRYRKGGFGRLFFSS